MKTVGEKMLRDMSDEDEEEWPLQMEGALLTYKAETFVSSPIKKLNLITNSTPLHLGKQKHGKMNNSVTNQCETVNFNWIIANFKSNR